MPLISAILTHSGPLIDLYFGVSIPRAKTLVRLGQPRPPHVQVRALLDTGSEVIVVDHSILPALALSPTGSSAIQTVTTGALAHVSDIFDISIWCPGDPIRLFRANVEVFSIDLSGFAYQALIGRNVLDQCRLVYDGPSRLCTLEYKLQSG